MAAAYRGYGEEVQSTGSGGELIRGRIIYYMELVLYSGKGVSLCLFFLLLPRLWKSGFYLI